MANPSKSASVTPSTISGVLTGISDTGHQQWCIGPKNPALYPPKEIASPFPEMTKALAAGDFSKFSPWLKERRWTDSDIKNLDTSLAMAKLFRPNTAAHAVHEMLLQQSVEKENIEVFKTVPMAFLQDMGDLATLIDLLKEKIHNFPNKQVYKDMDAVVAQVAPEDQYVLLKKTSVKV